VVGLAWVAERHLRILGARRRESSISLPTRTLRPLRWSIVPPGLAAFFPLFPALRFASCRANYGRRSAAVGVRSPRQNGQGLMPPDFSVRFSWGWKPHAFTDCRVKGCRAKGRGATFKPSNRGSSADHVCDDRDSSFDFATGEVLAQTSAQGFAPVWLRSQMMRRPSSVRNSSIVLMCRDAVPIRLACPPVAITFVLAPSTFFMRSRMPSTRSV
jgi:hypothetical protein